MKAKKAAAAKVSKATPEAQIVEDQVAGTAPEVQERVKSPTADFPIVGIGASAGGLEALEQFLRNVPENSGIAIIIIQHQDPDHEGMLPELLQRVTKMKVSRIVDRMRVKPNGVYVIPSGQDLSILHGVLHLFTPNAPRGLRLPIDFFFRSLADDRQAHSVGVILSGMGSDGTLGIKAIKELGGLVLTQEPASAKFDSMPRCAIESGMVDIVAPVGDLPGRTAFQRTVDRSNQFFSRSGTLGTSREKGDSGISGDYRSGQADAASLVGGLFDRGGSLFTGHHLQGGAGTAPAPGREFHAADLCHRFGSGCHQQSAPGNLSGQHRDGYISRATTAFFCQGRK